MAEVTYYFNGYNIDEGIYWNIPGYMTNDVLTNFASISSTGTWQWLLPNTCPGTDLGTITKVELRAYGYGDGGDKFNFYPWGKVTGTKHETIPATSAAWGGYVDITGDIEAPSWGWQNIVDQEVWVEYIKSGKANTMYCAKVEIRVTYTEAGAKTTQYLAGQDCPVFPHEKDLQSNKLPCPLPYD